MPRVRIGTDTQSKAFSKATRLRGLCAARCNPQSDPYCSDASAFYKVERRLRICVVTKTVPYYLKTSREGTEAEMGSWKTGTTADRPRRRLESGGGSLSVKEREGVQFISWSIISVTERELGPIMKCAIRWPPPPPHLLKELACFRSRAC